jgi:RND family efflux transporter MFP subunit
MEIHAPFPSKTPEGVTEPVVYAVAKRSVAEGQMVKVGEAVMQLVIETPLRLWANVPERHSAEVHIGQEVRVRVTSFPDTRFEGRVARINPSVDPSSRTFAVEAVIPNNRGLLRPGGFAKASILVDRSAEATVVPVESVVRFAGVTKVFVVEGQTARSVNVETGLEGPGWVEVVGKLPENARVVTEGYTQIADGTPVVVRDGSRRPDKPAGTERATTRVKVADPAG